jgi:hypothetical protein
MAHQGHTFESWRVRQKACAGSAGTVADGFRRMDGANEGFIGSASDPILLVVKASQRWHWTRAVELGVANDWADIPVGKRASRYYPAAFAVP